MIVCKNCGHQNDDNDTFCGSCGKFLEWTGERVAVAQPEPEPEPPPPAIAPEPVHHGFIDRVKQAVGIDEVAAQPSQPVPEPAAAPPPPPPQQVSASATPASGPAAPAPSSPPYQAPYRAPYQTAPPPAPPYQPPAAPYQPAAAAPPPPARVVPIMSAPPSAPAAAPSAIPAQPREPVLAGVGAPMAAPPSQPVPDEPISRRPTSVAPAMPRARPAPRTVEAPTRRRPGDLICGQCGEGNDPTRHFCRRCGNSLDEAITVQLPWYRRLWNRLFHRTYAAGYRHRRVGPPNVLGAFWRIVRIALGIIIVLAVLAFALVPSFRTGVINRVTSIVNPLRVQFFPHLDQVHPTGATASSAIAGHPPGLADDGFSNTYWAALPGDRAPFLKLTFASPTDLADIGFTSGAAGTAPTDQFLAQPRPHAVHLVFSDGSTQDITLADQQKAQFFAINAKQVTFVEIHIISVWQTAGAAPSSVAIAEVEFRIRD